MNTSSFPFRKEEEDEFKLSSFPFRKEQEDEF
jgi:hypothetical protein